MPSLWLLCVSAWAWSPGELRPLPFGTVPADLAAGTWQGVPALIAVGPDGVRILDPLGRREPVIARAPQGVAVLARNLDRAGDDELVVCGPDGLHLLRGDGGALRDPTRLASEPCEAVAAWETGAFDALVTVGEGRVVSWSPSGGTLQRSPRDGLTAAEPARVGASAGGVRILASDGRATPLADGAPLPVEGPLLDVIGLEPGLGRTPRFAALVGGKRPALWIDGRTLPLDEPAEAVVAAGPVVWVLDPERSRVGSVEGDEVSWWPVPVAPRVGVPLDADGDGCTDLVVADAEGGGALITGTCGSAWGGLVGAAPPPPAVVRAPAVEPPPPVPAPRPVGEPVRAIPAVPEEVWIGRDWGVLDVRVGDPVETRVTDGSASGGWRSRGGPPGFAVQASGLVEYVADEEDVGRWRVSVHKGGWSGFELRVWPAEGTVVLPGLESQGLVASSSGEVRRARAQGPLAIRSCALGLGAEAGIAQAGGVTWETLGGGDVIGGASPALLFTCAGGSDGPVQWFFGADSAPFYDWAAVPNNRRHVLAATAGGQYGNDLARVGVFGTGGFTLIGVGARGIWMPMQDWHGKPMGFEARLTWLVPQLGGQAVVAWIWTL